MNDNVTGSEVISGTKNTNSIYLPAHNLCWVRQPAVQRLIHSAYSVVCKDIKSWTYPGKTLALLQCSLQASRVDHLLHVQDTQVSPQDPPTHSAPEIEGQISSTHSARSGLQAMEVNMQRWGVQTRSNLNNQSAARFTRANSFTYHELRAKHLSWSADHTVCVQP